MKKDLAEVKAYAEAIAESNCVRDMYIDKEQDKFFCQLNRQWNEINALKEHAEPLELRARALELENESLSAHINSMADCYVQISKESGHSRGEEGESGSGSSSS